MVNEKVHALGELETKPDKSYSDDAGIRAIEAQLESLQRYQWALEWVLNEEEECQT